MTYDIQTLNRYPIPVPSQGAYKGSGYTAGMFPIAERYAKEEVSLPLWVGMGQEKLEGIVKCLNDAIAKLRLKDSMCSLGKSLKK